jgi:hypothetical protein
MFCEWRKFVVALEAERLFVLKFEAGFGGYRIFVTDFEQLWVEEVATEADLAQTLKVSKMCYNLSINCLRFRNALVLLKFVHVLL